GTLSASGGYFAGSSTLPTTRSPASFAKRTSVSAGVRDTIFFGSAVSWTLVPSSSVRVTGHAGAGDADRPGVAVIGGTSEPVASGGLDGRGVAALPHAARR